MRRNELAVALALSLSLSAGCQSLDFPESDGSFASGGDDGGRDGASGGAGPNTDTSGSGTGGGVGAETVYASDPNGGTGSTGTETPGDPLAGVCVDAPIASEHGGAPATFRGFASAEFTRSQVFAGQLPPQGSIREPEFVAYWGAHDATATPSIVASIFKETATALQGTLEIRVTLGGAPPVGDERAPGAYVIVADVSPSVAEAQAVELAALKALASSLQGDDVSLVTYAGSAREDLLHGTGADLAALVDGADGARILDTRGGDDLESALKLASALLEQSGADTFADRHLIVLSDGGTPASFQTLDVVDQIATNGARVTAVQLGKPARDPKSNSFHDAFFDALASNSDDVRLFVGSPSEADSVFGDRFGELFLTAYDGALVSALLPPGFSPATTVGTDPTVLPGSSLAYGRTYTFQEIVHVCADSELYAQQGGDSYVVHVELATDPTIFADEPYDAKFFESTAGGRLDRAVVSAARFFRTRAAADLQTARCALDALDTELGCGGSSAPNGVEMPLCASTVDLATVLDAAAPLTSPPLTPGCTKSP
ncbi:MAG TPA: vWA domain-containing protein [Polyangiaceae bacterium]|jgi:hypothetical protein|nr:vWA domain-containing protein [Polyangiaceae bacterium]